MARPLSGQASDPVGGPTGGLIDLGIDAVVWKFNEIVTRRTISSIAREAIGSGSL